MCGASSSPTGEILARLKAVPTGAVPTGAVPTGAVPTGAVPTGGEATGGGEGRSTWLDRRGARGR